MKKIFFILILFISVFFMSCTTRYIYVPNNNGYTQENRVYQQPNIRYVNPPQQRRVTISIWGGYNNGVPMYYQQRPPVYYPQQRPPVYPQPPIRRW